MGACSGTGRGGDTATASGHRGPSGEMKSLSAQVLPLNLDLTSTAQLHSTSATPHAGSSRVKGRQSARQRPNAETADGAPVLNAAKADPLAKPSVAAKAEARGGGKAESSRAPSRTPSIRTAPATAERTQKPASAAVSRPSSRQRLSDTHSIASRTSAAKSITKKAAPGVAEQRSMELSSLGVLALSIGTMEARR